MTGPDTPDRPTPADDHPGCGALPGTDGTAARSADPATVPMDPAPRVRRRPVPEIVANTLRGGLIGMVEAMPGVSGGTVALVVMIYERLIASATNAIAGVWELVSGLWRGPAVRSSGLGRLATVEWLLLGPLAVGMVLGLLTMSRFMEFLLHEHPVYMRAAFFGMVAVSLLVPIRLAGRFRPRDWVSFVVVALVAAVAVSLPPQNIAVNPVTILLCAAVAVCALALPGLSGSFILLSLGIYAPTIEAVNDRDLGYLGLFFLGAATGGVLIVLGLRKLLATRHHVTMVVITGLMAGGLRALWPWQDENRDFVTIPAAEVLPVLGLVLAGGLLVGIGVWLERRFAKDPQTDTGRRV
ncbi:DUF368 domain-containing protein [Brevibacterium litoralis]|uniref:DUF368 domain-containing protein n=1 Tax=Brevibacterium litoralis TaxID=3138935 RepID=UPI0032EFE3F2